MRYWLGKWRDSNGCCLSSLWQDSWYSFLWSPHRWTDELQIKQLDSDIDWQFANLPDLINCDYCHKPSWRPISSGMPQGLMPQPKLQDIHWWPGWWSIIRSCSCPSAQHWWDTLGVLCPVLDTHWNESREGSWGWLRDWSKCCTRRGWENWSCSAWRREGSEASYPCEWIPDEGVLPVRKTETNSSQWHPRTA